MRNSAAVINEWRHTLPWTLAKTIENQCIDVMQQLGYKQTESEQQYKETSISLVSGSQELTKGWMQQVLLQV